MLDFQAVSKSWPGDSQNMVSLMRVSFSRHGAAHCSAWLSRLCELGMYAAGNMSTLHPEIRYDSGIFD